MQRLLKSFALAIAGAVSLSSAALASDVRVAYGDLDLSRPVEAARFERRIHDAADAWCAANPGQGLPTLQDSDASCRRAVRAELRRAMPHEQREALRIARARPLPVELATR